MLLTERAHLLVEGMTIAARAIGAREGILYLRGEYVYLRDHLEAVLAERRQAGVEVRASERGEKRKMQEMAERNARLALDQDRARAARTREDPAN